MGRAVRELAHDLCQWGTALRMYATNHPAHLRDMDRVEGFFSGTKIRSDRKFAVASSPLKPTHAILQSNILAQQQKRQPWRVHQSLAAAQRGRCIWTKCPGWKKSKAKVKRPYITFMHCEECSATMGCNIFLCNDTKNGVAVCCHVAYHKRHHNKVFLSDER